MLFLVESEKKWTFGITSHSLSICQPVHNVNTAKPFAAGVLQGGSRTQEHIKQIPSKAWDCICVSSSNSTVIYTWNKICMKKSYGLKVGNPAFTKEANKPQSSWMAFTTGLHWVRQHAVKGGANTKSSSALCSFYILLPNFLFLPQHYSSHNWRRNWNKMSILFNYICIC